MTVPKRQKAYISLLNTWGKYVIAFKEIIPDQFQEERKYTQPLVEKSGLHVQGWKEC